MILEQQINTVRQWGHENELYSKCTIKNQVDKIYEEVGELKDSLIENDRDHSLTELGQVIHVIIGLSEMLGTTIQECLYLAIEQNKNRIYHVVDGELVREDKL
jgi:NTP pyrophosphatase (non-canonical NTP hydrolase)